MKVVHFMCDPSVKVESTYPIYQAFTDILKGLDVRDYFQMHDLGAWKDHGYQSGKMLVPHKSINWLLELAYNERVDKSLNLLNTQVLIAELQRYALTYRANYVIFITDKPTSHPTPGIGLTNGATCRYRNTIFSLSCVDAKHVYNLAMHEFGHLFGLILDTSRPHLVNSHCDYPNCIMQPFVKIRSVAQGFDSFCATCRKELHEFVNHVKTSS